MKRFLAGAAISVLSFATTDSRVEAMPYGAVDTGDLPDAQLPNEKRINAEGFDAEQHKDDFITDLERSLGQLGVTVITELPDALSENSILISPDGSGCTAEVILESNGNFLNVSSTLGLVSLTEYILDPVVLDSVSSIEKFAHGAADLRMADTVIETPLPKRWVAPYVAQTATRACSVYLEYAEAVGLIDDPLAIQPTGIQ